MWCVKHRSLTLTVLLLHNTSRTTTHLPCSSTRLTWTPLPSGPTLTQCLQETSSRCPMGCTMQTTCLCPCHHRHRLHWSRHALSAKAQTGAVLWSVTRKVRVQHAAAPATQQSPLPCVQMQPMWCPQKGIYCSSWNHAWASETTTLTKLHSTELQAITRYQSRPESRRVHIQHVLMGGQVRVNRGGSTCMTPSSAGCLHLSMCRVHGHSNLPHKPSNGQYDGAENCVLKY